MTIDIDAYKFQPQGDSPVDLSGREGYDPPRCYGYNATILGECGNERDEDKPLCDDCDDLRREDELRMNNEAYHREFGVERVRAYPNLTDEGEQR